MSAPYSADTSALGEPSAATPVGDSRLLSFLHNDERNSRDEHYANGVQQRLGSLRRGIRLSLRGSRLSLGGLHRGGLRWRLLRHLLADGVSRLLDRCCDC